MIPRLRNVIRIVAFESHDTGDRTPPCDRPCNRFKCYYNRPTARIRARLGFDPGRERILSEIVTRGLNIRTSTDRWRPRYYCPQNYDVTTSTTFFPARVCFAHHVRSRVAHGSLTLPVRIEGSLRSPSLSPFASRFPFGRPRRGKNGAKMRTRAKRASE